MFRGHWLVADLDGTLTPTPSKAGGSYYSLAQCARVFGASYVSCLPALRSFVAHGGSLCVVSTAGRRMWSQVYNDLADTLYPRLADVGRGHTPHNSNNNNNNDSDKTNDDDDATTGTSTLPGRLLLCGFTGAALFRSRAPASVWRDMQTHHHHDTRHDDDVTPTTTTTTNDARTTPPAAVGLEEWLAYRRCAAAPPHDNGHTATTITTASSSPATTMSDAVQRCAAEEGRAALVRFLEHASCVSGHDVARARVFFRGCLSRKYHDAFADLLAMVLQEVRATTTATTTATATTDDDNVAPLCFAHATPLAMTALATHGRYLRETNDALVDCQAVPRADGSVAADAPIAQVVIMGIPAAYYTRVFVDNDNDNDNSSHALQCCAVCAQRGRGALARLRACGLTVKSQPNSVCFHRTGVDKGTCVRWLCAHASTSAATASDDAAAAAAAAMTTSSSTDARAHTDKTDKSDNNNKDDDDDTLYFALARAIAFGDVPATVDRPLALAPPMTFVSLSLAEDDGLSSLSVAAADASTTMTSDDAPVRDNVVHVGGEEEGTALFLQELLQDCAAEATAAAASASPVAAHAAAAAATTQTLFTRARIEACAARARARLRDVQRARAEAAAVSSTLSS